MVAIWVSTRETPSSDVKAQTDQRPYYFAFLKGSYSCADPESFVRGGPTLTTFLLFIFINF